jgi:hypothetical protein
MTKRQVRSRTFTSPCNSILCMLMCFVYRQCWTWRKGVIHRYHMSTLSLSLLDEHDLPLYSGFFPFSYFFFVGGKGWCFIVIDVIQRIIESSLVRRLYNDITFNHSLIPILHSFKSKKLTRFYDIVNILSCIYYIIYNISLYRISDMIALTNIIVTNMTKCKERKRKENRKKRNKIV